MILLQIDVCHLRHFHYGADQIQQIVTVTTVDVLRPDAMVLNENIANYIRPDFRTIICRTFDGTHAQDLTTAASIFSLLQSLITAINKNMWELVPF